MKGRQELQELLGTARNYRVAGRGSRVAGRYAAPEARLSLNGVDRSPLLHRQPAVRPRLPLTPLAWLHALRRRAYRRQLRVPARNTMVRRSLRDGIGWDAWAAVATKFRNDQIVALKLELGTLIAAIVDGNRDDMGATLGIDRLRVAELRRGKFDRFSLESLVRILELLGYSVTIHADGRPAGLRASPRPPNVR